MSDVHGYEIEAELDGQIHTVTLIATSEERAISRTRLTLFHHLRSANAYDATYTVVRTMPLETFKQLRAAGLA